MKYTIISLIIFVLMAMTGCSRQLLVFEKPGSTEAEWTADTADCQLWATQMARGDANSITSGPTFNSSQAFGKGFSNGIISAINEADYYKKCMTIKGYTYTSKTE